MYISRRDFSKALLGGAAALALPRTGASSEVIHSSARNLDSSFSFVLLGDLHYDKLSHHRSDWLQQEHPHDVNQVANYSRITAEVHPQLFASVRETVTDLKTKTPVPFVLQVGDLVEGLCGSEELATQQDKDAVQFYQSANLGVPFLFIKGNHDITGPGAPEAFESVLLPFLAQQAAPLNVGKLSNACYTVEYGDSLFCCFDAYDPQSLDWLDAKLHKRTARHCFVAIHPPVVPYGARANWSLYINPRQSAQREHLLHILGQNDAIVLGGHIHKYNYMTRVTRTPQGGRFVQLGISSIVSRPGAAHASNELSGLAQYNGDQIKVEPNFSPDTEQERRAIYETEAPFVRDFQYADLPGHAVITVDGSEVTAQMYSGTSRELWRTVKLAG